MSAFLEDLRRTVESHEATNHLFLSRLRNSPFSRDDYGVFAENHFPLVRVFTSYLEHLLLRAPTNDSKLWLAKVLVDEYGEGSEGKNHATLYGEFVRACGSRFADDEASPVLPPAEAFIREHLRIVTEEPFLVGLGAVGPGHEWAIPKMFGSIIPGLRRAGFSEEEIFYFTLHVEQDEDHGSWLEEALAKYATTDDARAQILRGSLLSLEARARFWSGVQRAIVAFRQPRSVRLDAPTPRSTLHEIVLTAWDGSRTAQRIEHWLAQRSASKRITLAELDALAHQPGGPKPKLFGALS